MIPLVLSLALSMGHGAPSFSARMLDGTTLRAKDIEGKVVVVAFWATWCAPCLQELPHLDALAKARPDVVVIAAATDGPETSARIKGLVAQKKWSMPIALDPDGALRKRVGARADNPYVVVLDRAGAVAYAHAGYAPGDERALNEAVTKLAGVRK